MICKITNFLRIFLNRKKNRKIRKILKMKKFVKYKFSIYAEYRYHVNIVSISYRNQKSDIEASLMQYSDMWSL